MNIVCRNKYGTCNEFGSLNCKNCGSSCKIGYEGNRCQTCQKGFYISNGVAEGEVNSKTGEGVICKSMIINHIINFDWKYMFLL